MAGPKASVAHAWRPSSELTMDDLPAPDSPSSITVQVNGRSDSGPAAACAQQKVFQGAGLQGTPLSAQGLPSGWRKCCGIWTRLL